MRKIGKGYSRGPRDPGAKGQKGSTGATVVVKTVYRAQICNEHRQLVGRIQVTGTRCDRVIGIKIR